MHTLNDLDKQLLIAGGVGLFLNPSVDVPSVAGIGCFWTFRWGGAEKRHSAIFEAFFGGISTGEGLGKGCYDSYRGI